ncbi:MAG: class I SAM-dependent methyltransferase [Armatimonadetes bacterium]|nr:class I SAM-dependent methyltransferase [Armatimonadota bacterium]
MDHLEVGRLWNESSDTWSSLSRAGYDTCGLCLNTPTFLAMLPDVAGLRGLDIGCGEGGRTRDLARRGARMTGMDIAPRQIAHARDSVGSGIDWVVGSTAELPFADQSFDFATSLMVLDSVPQYGPALHEAARVLRTGGFLQFSICHPCTNNVPHRRKLRDENGRLYAVELGDYFQTGFYGIHEWTFGAAPAELRANLVPMRGVLIHYTLSDWLNALIRAGLRLERSEEPRAPDELVAAMPEFADEQCVPQAWIVRARKPATPPTAP